MVAFRETQSYRPFLFLAALQNSWDESCTSSCHKEKEIYHWPQHCLVAHVALRWGRMADYSYYTVGSQLQPGAVKLVLWHHWCMQLGCIQWPQRTNFTAPGCTIKISRWTELRMAAIFLENCLLTHSTAKKRDIVFPIRWVVDCFLSLASWDWKVKDIFTPATLLSGPVLILIDTRTKDL